MKKLEKAQQEKIAAGIRNELGEETTVSISVRNKIPKTPDFVMIYQEVGKRILEGDISLSTSKVFFYLIMNMSFENFIGIDQKSIGENISMPLRTVNKAMSELKSAGMLLSIKDNFDARRMVYRLNPVIAWKGKVRSRVKMIKENPDQIKLFAEMEQKHSLLPSLKKT